MNALIYKIVDCVVEVGQSDKQFKLGETIRYKPSELLEILKEHETEIFAESDRKTGEWITHRLGKELFSWGFDCSVCKEWYVVDEKYIGQYNYCPNCGSYNGGKKDEID